MKILITLLLALFISGQAYAEQTMKEHCAQLEGDILASVRALEDYSDNPDSKFAKIWKDLYKEKAKLYHYLDCSDFRN